MRGQGRVYRPVALKHRAGCPVRAPAKCDCPRVESQVWWLQYSVHGQSHREPSGTTSKREAQRILRERMGDRESGKVVGRPDHVMLAEYVKDAEGKKQLVGGLRWLHETQYDLDGLRSKERIQQCWNHIEKLLGADAKVTEVTPLRLDAYSKARLAEKAARATVNNELSVLRRAFNLAIEKGLLATMPVIKLAKVDNAREGFFEEGDFAAVLLALPAYCQPPVKFLRVTGWRVEEALGLTWDRVDWEQQGVRLSAQQTKGKKARLFPFGLAPDLKDVLEAAWATRNGPFVFQGPGRGKGVRVGPDRLGYTTLLHHWQRATKVAGCEGRLIHDLRRTAARDFRRAGVDEGTIMVLCGWKRRDTFDRYNIVSETDLAEAVAKRYGKTMAKPQGTAAAVPPLSSTAAKDA